MPTTSHHNIEIYKKSFKFWQDSANYSILLPHSWCIIWQMGEWCHSRLPLWCHSLLYDVTIGSWHRWVTLQWILNNHKTEQKNSKFFPHLHQKNQSWQLPFTRLPGHTKWHIDNISPFSSYAFMRYCVDGKCGWTDRHTDTNDRNTSQGFWQRHKNS